MTTFWIVWGVLNFIFAMVVYAHHVWRNLVAVVAMHALYSRQEYDAKTLAMRSYEIADKMEFERKHRW
jgi:hypothetical protein